MPLADLILALQSAGSLDSMDKAVQALQYEIELRRMAELVANGTRTGDISTHVLFVEPVRQERRTRWKARLAVQLAGYNGCRAVGVKPPPALVLIGKEKSAKVVRLVFLLLVTLIDNLCDQASKSDPNWAGVRNRHRFRNTAVRVVAKALESAVARAHAKAAPEVTSLLNHELWDVKRWIKENVHLITTTNLFCAPDKRA